MQNMSVLAGVLKEILHNLFQSNGKKTPINIESLKFSGSFRIPEKIYGREEEIITLRNEFFSVSSKKKSKSIVFVSGISGVGKTELVKEVQTSILLVDEIFRLVEASLQTNALSSSLKLISELIRLTS